MHKKAPCLSPYHVRKHLRIDIPVICMPARRCCQVGQAYKCLVFSMFLLGVEVLQPKPRAASAQSWQDPCGTVIYLYLTEKFGKRTNMLCPRWTSSEHRFATCLRGSTTRAEHFGNRMLPKAQKRMAGQTSPKGKFGARSASTAYRKDQTFSSGQDPSVMNVCTDLLHGKLL